MAERQTPDPLRGAFRWAWHETPRHRDRFAVSVVILGLASIVISNLITIPTDVSAGARIGLTTLSFVAAVVLAIVVAFFWALLRAPYEQREELRIMVSALTAERNALASQKQDFTAPMIHHQTIRLTDLPMDPNGIVRGKRFEHCVIVGPGLIAALSGTNLSGLSFSAPHPDGLVWTAPNAPVLCVVGLEYCEFLDCRMERIAFATSAKQAPYLKQMLAGEISGYKIGKNEDDITVIPKA